MKVSQAAAKKAVLDTLAKDGRAGIFAGTGTPCIWRPAPRTKTQRIFDKIAKTLVEQLCRTEIRKMRRRRDKRQEPK